MANSIVQTIREAEIDARSLSEFIYSPADAMISRRLAPSIHSLQYYLDFLNSIPSIIQGAIDTTVIENSPVSDALVSVDGSLSQRTINRGLESIADLSTINNPKDGLRVYVKSYFAGRGTGGGIFIWDANSTKPHDGGTVFQKEGVEIGRFVREDREELTFYDFGIVSGEQPEDDFRNTEQYKLAYAYFVNKAKGDTLYVPKGSFGFSEPVVVNGFYLKGADTIASSCIIALRHANPTSLLTIVNYSGYWGTVDYTKIIAPIIVGGEYYGGVEGVRILTRNLGKADVTHGVFDSISRYHKFDNLVITTNSQVGFESLGGFLSEYGDMDIDGPDEGVIIGPGPNLNGGNSPTFGTIWVKNVKGRAFESYNMSELNIDRLYVESILEARTDDTPLVVLRSANNSRIGQLTFDKVNAANLDSLIKVRASDNGAVENMNIVACNPTTKTAVFNLWGSGSFTFGGGYYRNSSNFYTSKVSATTPKNDLRFTGSLDSFGSIGENTTSEDFKLQNIKYEQTVFTGDRLFRDIKILKIDSARSDPILCVVDLMLVSAVNNNASVERIMFAISEDDTISGIKRDTQDILGVGVEATLGIVNDGAYKSLTVTKLGTTYSGGVIRVEAVARAKSIINPKYK